MISACLWDLRAQCEEQLRRLTAAQRAAEGHQSGNQSPGLTKRRLQTEIERVLDANAVIRETSHNCVRLIEQLAD